MSLVGIATAAIAVLVAVRFAVLAVRSAGVAQVRAEGTRRRLRPKLPALRRRYRTDPVPPQHKTAGLYRAGHGAWFAALLGGSFVRGSLPAGMGASSSAWRSSPRSPRSAGYHGELPVVFSASIRPPPPLRRHWPGCSAAAASDHGLRGDRSARGGRWPPTACGDGECPDSHAPAGGQTPMTSERMTIVTSSCETFSTVSPRGRRSKASWVMNRAAVNPAHRSTPVTTALARNPPP